MIVRARCVVTMAGEPIPNGAVAVERNEIVDVGTWPQVRGRNGGKVLDLGERVLLPGLINGHCHVDYTDLRGAIPRPSSFADWIRAINERKAAWSERDYVRSIERGFEEAKGFGTTTLVNFEGYPELIAKIASPPLRTWWLAEMIDVRGAVSVDRVLETLRSATGNDCLSRIGLAPHALYTASRELFGVAAETNLPLGTHLAESREEMEMFRDGSGALFEMLKGIGRPMNDCGGNTPLALFLEYGVANAQRIVAHLNELTPADFQLLDHAPPLHVVHCPRSHRYFGHARFPFRDLRAVSINICLGTDSLASNDDLSLFAEMRAFREKFPDTLPKDLLSMVTLNAARALGQSGRLGQLQRGSLADLIALPFTGGEEILYDEIVDFRGLVPWLMIDGRIAIAT